MEQAPHTMLGQLPLHVRAAMHADKMHKSSDHRRSNKPIMEKRRRARINHCLGELKGLILDAMKKDPARHSKLEKADILEMTVKHLQNMQRQQMAIAVATDPSVMTRFRNGFGECATEVARYVARLDGVDPAMRQRLLSHLRSCLSGLNQLSPAAFACLVPGLTGGSGMSGGGSFLHSPFQPLHVPPAAFSQFAANLSGSNLCGDANTKSGVSASRGMVGGLHLFPSRLPNGDIAFVLPSGGEEYSAPSDAAPPASAPSPFSSPSPSPPPVVPAQYLPPAFPTNPPGRPSVATISSTSERRTPSAFTSVLNNVAAPTSRVLPPAVPLSTCSDVPTRAASPSPGSSTCTVSSTTSSGKLGLPSPLGGSYEGSDMGCGPSTTTGAATEGDAAPAEVVKRESGRDTGEQHHRLALSAKSMCKQNGGSDEAVVVSTLIKTESDVSTNKTNQTEAYDLSRPSTSVSDNDVMWRPW